MSGWVASLRAIADRRAKARQLIGKRLLEVRYVNIDYHGWALGHHDGGRRAITDDAEWQDPTWDGGTFHHLDFGTEFIADDGEACSVTWDLPGGCESLRLQSGVISDSGAVWDVTDRQPWRTFLQLPVTDVQLRYLPGDYDQGGFCCSRISISFGTRHVEILLGDREADGTRLVPSTDNIAIVFDASNLPAWERTDDLI